jgi:geranylgeranyl pyrophosphate synthase
MPTGCLIGDSSLNNVEFLNLIAEDIEEVEELMRSRSEGYHPDLGAAMQHLLSAGGKRIRPTVALLMGKLLEADHRDLILLGASIELLHTATLVHDDLIDGSLLRRGNPTLNSDWSPAATVLTGDYIFAQAAELAAEIGSTEVMGLFAETLAVIVNGEISQLFSRKKQTSRSAYLQRIYEKTGSLFVLATKSAALLSGSSEAKIQAAVVYGREIGNAFQIVDDVLDFTGTRETIGKPIGSDLRQGVLTLPTLYYLEGKPDDQVLEKVLAGNHNGADLKEVLGRIKASGVVQRSLQDARKFSQRAVQALEDFPDKEEKQALIELAEFIVGRNI